MQFILFLGGDPGQHFLPLETQVSVYHAMVVSAGIALRQFADTGLVPIREAFHVQEQLILHVSQALVFAQFLAATQETMQAIAEVGYPFAFGLLKGMRLAGIGA